jgi:hypothetical protein
MPFVLLMRALLERNRPARSASAFLLVGVFFFLLALASSQSLHQRFHSDAATAGHHCVVTLFARAHIDAAPAPATVAPSPLFAGIVLLSDVLTHASADYYFSPSRAPPSLLA